MIKNKLTKPYIVGIVFVIVALLIFLLVIIFKYEKIIEKDMFKIATSDVLQITQHKALYIEDILKDSPNYIKTIKEDKELQKYLEKNIKSLITNNIKYAYILYKDKNEIFRFLIDGSPEDEKSMINQKFDVSDNKWYEVYEEEKPKIIKHSVLQSLSISYLVPIKKDNKVELILAIDFSVNKIIKINQIITMMKSGLIFILSILLISLALLIFQLVKYRKMKKSSYTDILTNTYNKNYLYEIQNEITLSDYVLAVLDIDHFKNINDTYGHTVGDIALKQIGNILSSATRLNEDIVIRYGGEEFVILIKTKLGNTKIPLDILQRIFNTIKNHQIFINEKDYINLTVSIGVNTNLNEYKNFLEAFEAADSALYKAKNSGRDKIEIYNKCNDD